MIAAASEFIYILRPARIAMVLDGPTDRERELVGADLAYLQPLHARGTVVLAGRTGTADKRVFGIVEFRAASLEEAQHLMRDDRAVPQGVIA